MKLIQRVVVISFSWVALWWTTHSVWAQSPAQPPTVTSPGTPPKDWGEHLNTPGAQLTCAKLTRETVRGRPAISYSLQASGLPKDKTYTLWTKWVDGLTEAAPPQMGITESGDVVAHREAKVGEQPKPSTPVRFGWTQMFLGEPIQHALISSDKTVQAFLKVIPFPLEATGPGGCRVSLELVDPTGQTFFVGLDGFKADEEITTVSKSGKEVIEGKVKLSKEGKLDGGGIYLRPAVIGKKGGTATFTTRGKECGVTLQYNWGNAMKRP